MLTLEKLEKAIQLWKIEPPYKEGAPNKIIVEHYANCDDETGMLLHPDHPKQSTERFECCECKPFDKYSMIATFEEGGTEERFLIIPNSAIVSIKPIKD